jgi:hypothetical protein
LTGVKEVKGVKEVIVAYSHLDNSRNYTTAEAFVF